MVGKKNVAHPTRLYAGADPINNIDPTGKNFTLSGVNAANVISGVLLSAGLSYAGWEFLTVGGPYMDSRKDVYLDFKRMRTPGFNKIAVQRAVIGKMTKDFSSFGVNFKPGRGNFLERTITFGGDSATIYGFGFWLHGVTYTDAILKDLSALTYRSHC
jgi:hypothetical protein